MLYLSQELPYAAFADVIYLSLLRVRVRVRTPSPPAEASTLRPYGGSAAVPLSGSFSSTRARYHWLARQG